MSMRYLIFGAARSGLAAARLLKSKGHDLVLADEKPESALQSAIEQMAPLGVLCRFGAPAAEEWLEGMDYLLISPGVPQTHPIVLAAHKRRIEVTGELEIGFQYAERPIASISGTNGKSTTTHLTSAIMNAGGWKCRAVGNIGDPICNAVLEPPNPAQREALAVEVSSYQLETIKTFHPRAAILTNITPDHLDRHGSMEKYCNMKFRITENQTADDFMIINADDRWCAPLKDKTKAKVLLFSIEREVHPGAYLQDNTIWLDVEEKTPLLTREEIPIPGLHNVQNALAASLAGAAFGVSAPMIAKAIREFPGVEHRIEFSGNINGVDFFNDSKATNLDSMEKALLSFTRPIILIAGGRDKNSDYSALNNLIRERVKYLVAMGEAEPLIRRAWETIVPAVSASDMKDAVRKAYQLSAPGDVALLSPGCSSFDAFKDFEERGRVFKKEVQNLKKESEK